MLSLTLNRIAIALGFVGLFVAGVLSYSHMANVVPPCMANEQVDCLAVTRSVFGSIGGLPVAYLGFFGYAAIVGLAVWRSYAEGALWRKLALVGVIITGAGSVYSIYLQIASIAGLGTKCPWCIGSAVTMVLSFLAHSGMAQVGPPAKREPNRDLTIAAVCCVLSFGMIGQQAASMPGVLKEFSKDVNLKGASISTLMPDKSKVRGNPDAKVAVIEFADMMCGSCRLNAPKMKAVFEKYGGRLAWGYRHFPLYNVNGHENSVMLAMFSEYAATKGKFWEFLDIVFESTNDERIKSESSIYAMAKEAGLDTADLKKAYEEALAKETSMLTNVNDDFTTAGNKLKIKSTPTFLLVAEGGVPEVVMPDQIPELLKQEPYASMLAQ